MSGRDVRISTGCTAAQFNALTYFTDANELRQRPKLYFTEKECAKGENPGKGAGTHEPRTGLDSTQDDSHYEQINEPVVHLGDFFIHFRSTMPPLDARY
jgi:hypothetical protein